MIIPREDKLVRIYCQLSSVKPGSDGRLDRSQITPDSILRAAQNILKPYKLEYKHRDWWTVYQVSFSTHRFPVIVHETFWISSCISQSYRLVKESATISAPMSGPSYAEMLFIVIVPRQDKG